MEKDTKIDKEDIKKLVELLKKDSDEETTDHLEITDHNFDEVEEALGESELVKVIREELENTGSFNLSSLREDTSDPRIEDEKEKDYKGTGGEYKRKINDIYETDPKKPYGADINSQGYEAVKYEEDRREN